MDPRMQKIEEENEQLRGQLAETRAALDELCAEATRLSVENIEPRIALAKIGYLGRELERLRNEKVKSARRHGFSYAQVAAEFGVSRQYVHHWLRREAD